MAAARAQPSTLIRSGTVTDDLLRQLRAEHPRWGVLRDVGGRPWVAVRGLDLLVEANTAEELREQIRQHRLGRPQRGDATRRSQRLQQFAVYLLRLHTPIGRRGSETCPRCGVPAQDCDINRIAVQFGLPHS